MVKYILDLPDEINDKLEEIAKRNSITRDEVIFLAFCVYSFVEREKHQGFSLGTYKIREGGIDIHPMIDYLGESL